ncbi:hypothetical protein [Streptomyces similanensis]|uniref:Uncharacterized protein n=1 Tax=Streptomyces similanensis TaxID=1274988 RepID=A0ABP9L419_9ACTN
MSSELPPLVPCTDPDHTGPRRELLGCVGPEPAPPALTSGVTGAALQWTGFSVASSPGAAGRSGS